MSLPSFFESLKDDIFEFLKDKLNPDNIPGGPLAKPASEDYELLATPFQDKKNLWYVVIGIGLPNGINQHPYSLTITTADQNNRVWDSWSVVESDSGTPINYATIFEFQLKHKMLVPALGKLSVSQNSVDLNTQAIAIRFPSFIDAVRFL